VLSIFEFPSQTAYHSLRKVDVFVNQRNDIFAMLGQGVQAVQFPTAQRTWGSALNELYTKLNRILPSGGVRFCTVVSLFLLVAHVQFSVAATPEKNAADLRRQANELIRQGDFQRAAELLSMSDPAQSDANTLMQLLDLQVRLQDETGANQSLAALRSLLAKSRGPANHRDMQLRGAIAGALNRLGRTEEAEAQWRQMKSSAGTSSLALAVFQAYRQARLLSEALEWAENCRDTFKDSSLWALELASLYQASGRWLDALDELLLWAGTQRQNSSFLGRRLLQLVDAAESAPELMRQMERRALEKDCSLPASKALLDALVQARSWPAASRVARQLDSGESGELSFALARSLVEAGETELALSELHDLGERTTLPTTRGAEFYMLQAECLEMDGQLEAAFEACERVRLQPGPLARQASLTAARLALELGRPQEAVSRYERLLGDHPDWFAAGRDYLRLLAARDDLDRAESLLIGLAGSSTVQRDHGTELDFLWLRLLLWQGRFSELEERLGHFLKQSLRHDDFNDAIAMMDLLGMGLRDSLGLSLVADAERLAFADLPIDAIHLLDKTASSGDHQAFAEWVAWRACSLAPLAEEPAARRQRFARFLADWPESIHGERVALLDFEAMELNGAGFDELRQAGLLIIERWPEGVLQDAVRRRLRQLEERENS
jgi:hypothetical protein